MAEKVVIENAVLRGSDHDDLLQKVAKVYVHGEEIRILAPPKATGSALEWSDHWSVREPNKESFGVEDVLPNTDFRRSLAIQAVKEELQKLIRDANRPMGMNPDGLYYDAQICLNGHVQSAGGFPFKQGEHCNKCGADCIDECLKCKTPIRGMVANTNWIGYDAPSFCHACGHPYPWMEDRLQTAKELLYHDDKLSLEEREKLWGLLQYVMTDPKSDMAPAKKKLFEIGVAKALPATREFFLDLMAKLGAEMLKP
jgi:hypothetical protein